MNADDIRKAIEETPDRALLHGIADVFATLLGADSDSDLARLLHQGADDVADAATAERDHRSNPEDRT